MMSFSGHEFSFLFLLHISSTIELRRAMRGLLGTHCPCMRCMDAWLTGQQREKGVLGEGASLLPCFPVCNPVLALNRVNPFFFD
jgi:hypothetical protein